jgi:hypothetical protein
MNQPKRYKRKLTYFEHKKVFNVLEQIAKNQTKRHHEVQKVTVPQLIREDTLKLANRYLIDHGKEPIDYDTSAGKFAPKGIRSTPLKKVEPKAVRAVVDIKGNVTVYDKKGSKLPNWKKLEELPRLLSLCPKCRVVLKVGEQEFHGILPLLLSTRQ